jgi:bifunctional DNase/RNase
MLKEGRIRSLLTVGLCLAASIWLSGEAVAKGVAPVALDQKELLQVKVHRLIIDPASRQPVVFLADPLEERGLPIWIGHCEANAISAELQGIRHPRPLTHDLLERILQKVNWKLQRIVVTHSKEGTYYATMVIERGDSQVEIDARPSDSIVMALKFKAPIFVSKSLFSEMAVPLGEKKGIEELYGLTVQELTPLLAQSFSYQSTRGVLVSDVQQGSLAEKDGIRRGDIFMKVGGETVGDVMTLKGALARSKAPVQAMIFRKGNSLSVRLHPPK